MKLAKLTLVAESFRAPRRTGGAVVPRDNSLLNIHSGSTGIADKRDNVIEVRGVDVSAFWAHNLLDAIFYVGFGGSRDPDF
jgi:hypothetical protein